MPKRKRSPLLNPLSHNETTIKQLQVAGLTENDLLPSTYLAGFPHRPLSTPDRDQRKEEPRPKPAAGDAQEQHLGVLVAVILTSLDQDDMARARRAFGLVCRTQVRGHPVDLRRQGLWTLGAEILMREGGRQQDDDDDKKRWGATGNLPHLRAYLECLIRQYPYNRLHPTSVSDLDFYPVLFGCEVYDVWVEHKRADVPVDDALATLRGLAARMDTLLENAPYNRSVELLRLRGMVALLMGDWAAPPGARDEARTQAKLFFQRMRDQTEGHVDARVQRWLQDEEDSDDGLPVFSSLPLR